MKSTINKATPQPKTYETENDISQNRRVEISALFNQCLADAVDLQTQMKQAHWNVKGPHFIGLHELFDKIDEAVEAYVDLIAERIVQLGGIAEGTTRVAAGRSRLEEYPLTIADGSAHVEAVAKALSTFGHEARNSIDRLPFRPPRRAFPGKSHFGWVQNATASVLPFLLRTDGRGGSGVKCAFVSAAHHQNGNAETGQG